MDNYAGSFFFDVEINKNGNPLFFGRAKSSNANGYHIVETDWDGVVLSEKVIPIQNGGGLFSVHPRMEVLKLQNNGFLITADQIMDDCTHDDSQLYWLDSDANIISSTIFGTPVNYEILYNAIQLPDGSVIIVGGFYDWG